MWESGKRERIGTWPGASARAFLRSWIAQRCSLSILGLVNRKEREDRRCRALAGGPRCPQRGWVHEPADLPLWSRWLACGPGARCFGGATAMELRIPAAPLWNVAP